MTIERRLVTYRELKALGVPYSRQHLSRLEKQKPPAFPIRVRLGACRVAWILAEIEAWLQARIDARPSTA